MARLLLSVVKSQRLSLFGRMACIDGKASASQILLEPAPEYWRKPPGWPQFTWLKNITDSLRSFDMSLHSARDQLRTWVSGCALLVMKDDTGFGW